MNLIKTALAAAMLLAAPLVNASAQCSLAITSCGGSDEHTTQSTGGSFGNVREHAACSMCLDYGFPAPAAVCHECASELTTTQQVAYKQVQRAGQVGDVEVVMRLARELPEAMVTYNVSRNSIQIKSCSGRQVIGSLPLRSSAQLQVAMSLPREDRAPSPIRNATQME